MMISIILNIYSAYEVEVPSLTIVISKQSGEVHRCINICKDGIGSMVIDTLTKHNLPMPTTNGLAGVGVNLLTVDLLLEISALCTYGDFSSSVDISSISSYMHANHAYFCDQVVKSASVLHQDNAVRHEHT